MIFGLKSYDYHEYTAFVSKSATGVQVLHRI